MSRRHPDYQDDFLPLDRRIHGGDGHFKQDHHLKRFALSGVELPVMAYPGLFPGQTTLNGIDGGTARQWLNVRRFHPTYAVYDPATGRAGLWVADWEFAPGEKSQYLFMQNKESNLFCERAVDSDFQAIVTKEPPKLVNVEAGEPVEEWEIVNPEPWGYNNTHTITGTFSLDGSLIGSSVVWTHDHAEESFPPIDVYRATTVWSTETATRTNQYWHLKEGTFDENLRKTSGTTSADGIGFMPFGLPDDSPPNPMVYAYWTEETAFEDNGMDTSIRESEREIEWTWVITLGEVDYVEIKDWAIDQETVTEDANALYTSRATINGHAEELHETMTEGYHLDEFVDGTTVTGSASDLLQGTRHQFVFQAYKHAEQNATEPDYATAETTLFAQRISSKRDYAYTAYPEDGWVKHVSKDISTREVECIIYDWKSGEKIASRTYPDGKIDGMTITGLCLTYMQAVPQGA